eukprot:TRINITY_DN13828_c0_g2_i1.p1 TRINITY_DN13828_c0_g2~~TRINITY_DN13828_c0_g2_i1.p1  ORF type:complete len:409 (-),score=98.11 TRINITY_DN13828_c0_g2_i1:247-1341(-)
METSSHVEDVLHPPSAQTEDLMYPPTSLSEDNADTTPTDALTEHGMDPSPSDPTIVDPLHSPAPEDEGMIVPPHHDEPCTKMLIEQMKKTTYSDGSEWTIKVTNEGPLPVKAIVIHTEAEGVFGTWGLNIVSPLTYSYVFPVNVTYLPPFHSLSSGYKISSQESVPFFISRVECGAAGAHLANQVKVVASDDPNPLAPPPSTDPIQPPPEDLNSASQSPPTDPAPRVINNGGMPPTSNFEIMSCFSNHPKCGVRITSLPKHAWTIEGTTRELVQADLIILNTGSAPITEVALSFGVNFCEPGLCPDTPKFFVEQFWGLHFYNGFYMASLSEQLPIPAGQSYTGAGITYKGPIYPTVVSLACQLD